MKSMHVKNADLWPSTIYCGGTVIKFLVGKNGRRVKIESHGENPPLPRHKRMTKRPRRRYNDRRG